MTDEEILLRLCLENPSDTCARGAYADYLMEYGEDDWARERGAFINWHIAVSGQPFGQEMSDQYDAWSEKIWYLFSGRIPLVRESRRASRYWRKDHDIRCGVHVSGGHRDGEIVIRNGMPEKLLIPMGSFLGTPGANRGCPQCMGRGFTEAVERPPLDWLTEIAADPVPNTEFRTIQIPCNYCGHGYGVEIGKRWPIVEIQFTDGLQEAFSRSGQRWSFWGRHVDMREVLLETNRPDELPRVAVRLVGHAAVNGMRGLHHLPPLPLPVTPEHASRTVERPAEPPSSSRR